MTKGHRKHMYTSLYFLQICSSLTWEYILLCILIEYLCNKLWALNYKLLNIKIYADDHQNQWDIIEPTIKQGSSLGHWSGPAQCGDFPAQTRLIHIMLSVLKGLFGPPGPELTKSSIDHFVVELFISMWCLSKEEAFSKTFHNTEHSLLLMFAAQALLSIITCNFCL